MRNAPVRFSANDGFTPFGSHASFGPLTPRSHLGGVGVGFKEEEKEEYSDSDEPGLGRVDISEVKALDWMAPDTLKKVSEVKRKKDKVPPLGQPGTMHFS